VTRILASDSESISIDISLSSFPLKLGSESSADPSAPVSAPVTDVQPEDQSELEESDTIDGGRSWLEFRWYLLEQAPLLNWQHM
jgi:hypothetical protein